jgi:ADP-heptose:LPS heptosyltransferase
MSVDSSNTNSNPSSEGAEIVQTHEERKGGHSGPPKIRCLVLQLARLGDTLQSLMALRAAQQLYPHLEITFVARERFADGARKVPWLHQVITLDSETVLSPHLRGEATEDETLTALAQWVRPLSMENWDLLLNWSFSEASSYLAAVIPARVKLGYSRRNDPQLNQTAVDGWSQYLQAIVQGDVHQNIHLTDILTTQLLTALQIHHGEPKADSSLPVTSKHFFEISSDVDLMNDEWFHPSKKWIAIQLGAAQEAKTWPVESWAKLAAQIIDRKPECQLLLLGGKDDEGRASEFLSHLSAQPRHLDAVINLVGDTRFERWVAAISRSEWLLSGDTAAIHLASLLGTRVLNISCGPVRWNETGPYGNGHYVITSAEPCQACEIKGTQEGHTCRTSITPDAVYGAWSYAASEWAHRRNQTLLSQFEKLERGEDFKKILVYRSRIRPSHEGGGVVYESLSNPKMSMNHWMSMINGHMARSWYCGWVPAMGQELRAQDLSPTLLAQLRELSQSTEVLSRICNEARKLSLIIHRRCSKMKSEKVMKIEARAELQEYGQKLLELDELLHRLGKVHAPLRSFSQMSRVMMHNLRGEKIADIGLQTAEAYRQLGEGVTLLRDWIKHTLELSRPRAVRTEPVLQVVTQELNS